MPRVIWKGAITFGLVHVPVALYPASTETGVDFDWLDKRTMDPVGYQRVNKRTGKEITRENIVKGVKVDGGDYVVVSEEEIKAAFPKSTQTIEIECFVKASDIDFVLLERPYYLEPAGKADKVYVLLREAMRDAGVIGIARVVMHSKEHLAVLVPAGAALVLNTIRWASEIRSLDELKLPAAGKAAANLKPAELSMAAQLIKDMTSDWKAEAYTDTFTAAVEALVQRKHAAGETEQVAPVEPALDGATPSNVVDLTELLSRSLGRKAAPATARKPIAPPAPSAKKAATKKPTPPLRSPAARKRA